MRKFVTNLELRFGGLVLLYVMWFFGDAELLFVVFGNALIHELGHYIMLSHYGVRVRKLIFDYTGFTMLCNTSYLPNGANVAVALGGPFMGAVAALIASVLGNVMQNEFLLLFSGVGVILSAFNLLPAKPLDGWRVVHVIFPALSMGISMIAACLVLSLGLYVLYLGYGTALAMLGLVLLLQDDRLNGRRFTF